MIFAGVVRMFEDRKAKGTNAGPEELECRCKGASVALGEASDQQIEFLEFLSQRFVVSSLGRSGPVVTHSFFRSHGSESRLYP